MRLCALLVIMCALLCFTSQAQILYSTAGGDRNDFDGTVGGTIMIGSSAALVTHLGFYDSNGDGLALAHPVVILKYSDSSVVASNVVPAGTAGYLTNDYRYIALNPPVLLEPNTAYRLQAEVASGDGDGWPDTDAATTWNPYYVGSTPASSRFAGWGNNYGRDYPIGDSTDFDAVYGAPNMAVLPFGPATAFIQIPNVVTQYATLDVTLTAYVAGAAPMSVQWYKAPDTKLTGETNTSLTLTHLTEGDAGDYYVIADNGTSSQSGNVTLMVLADQPVSITQNPASTNEYQNFPVSFMVAADGTAPISYQWNRNSQPIAGATNSVYTLVAKAVNDGDTFSCTVSNYANGSPQTVTSDPATLTVLPNVALPQHLLYDVAGKTDLTYRDDFTGVVGGSFQVGASDALVTHLGFYCTNAAGLNANHHVGIYDADSGQLVTSVDVPAGTGPLQVNDYAWVALDSPLWLTNGGNYVLGAEIGASDGDFWPDKDNPGNWNPYFVGSTAPDTRVNMWNATGWPDIPVNPGDPDFWYLAGNMALLAAGPPGIVVLGETTITQYVGFDVTIQTQPFGEVPMTAQWFKSPNQQLDGQTNASLTLSNLTLDDAGTYYLVVSNSINTAQSPDFTLNVLPVAKPTITEQPAAVSAYPHQTVSFAVTAMGTPPLNYQWTFGNQPLSDATNRVLNIDNVSSANVGNYRVIVSNAYGSATNDPSANLTIITPPANSYFASVINAQPSLYYRFNETDVSQPAANFGSKGAAFDGTYESGYSGAVYFDAGPRPPTYPRFEADNQAVILNGLQSDVAIPPLNFGSSVDTTIVAWINSYDNQADWTGLVFNRATGSASGIGLRDVSDTDPTDMLQYHWANAQYDFISDLYVTNFNQWTFVALVVQPDRGVLYLDDGTGMQSATNIAPHDPATFASPTYIGWDPFASDRAFYGGMDEVMVFRRALSASEIADVYNGTYSAPVSLSVQPANGKIILSWPSGTLQSATEATGPFDNMTGVTSPYTNTPSGDRKFFRVKL